MQTNTKRLEWIDALRGALMFFIVLGHSLSFIHFSENPVNHYLYSFHVPAFFFVSGFFASARGKKFIPFLLSKVRTLLVPYFLFSLISIGIFQVLGAFAGEKLGIEAAGNLRDNLLGMLYASGTTGNLKFNLPLWFLPCLFVTSLLFFPLEKLLARAKPEQQKRLFVLSALFFFALGALNFHLLHVRALPFGLETAIYLMPFYVLGHLARPILTEKPTKKPVSLALGGTLVLLGGSTAFLNGRVETVHSAFSNFSLFFLSALLSIFGYCLLSRALTARSLSFVGRHTLGILVLHKFPIVALQALLPKLLSAQNLLVKNALGLVIALVATALSLVGTLIIQTILPFALGKKKEL